jgi:hypothetical protein
MLLDQTSLERDASKPEQRHAKRALHQIANRSERDKHAVIQQYDTTSGDKHEETRGVKLHHLVQIEKRRQLMFDRSRIPLSVSSFSHQC